METNKNIMPILKDNSVIDNSKKQGPFLSLARKDYTARINQKRNGLLGHGLTTEERELEPYKLHVSLSKEAYPKYKIRLISLLKKALQDNIIDVCKCTNEAYHALRMGQCEEMIMLINERKVALPIGMTETTDVFQPTETFRKHKRLLDGDQLTIYISKPPNNNNILILCHNIEICLSGVEPGAMCDAASPVSMHISFRQDHLNGIYVDPVLLNDIELNRFALTRPRKISSTN